MLWVDLDAEIAIPAVEWWVSGLATEEATQEAQHFITALMGTRRSRHTNPGRGDFCTVKHLKAPYLLMHRHIRSSDDIQRVGKGVFRPELRDDAQDARNLGIGLKHAQFVERDALFIEFLNMVFFVVLLKPSFLRY